ncbi:arylsulfatase [Haloferax sp. Atlit-10N]|uniref:sulfatase n=1 Tax=Haloferax TaxID=2251 RepID=UPI0006786A0D|nr:MULTISPECIES: sulfatase [Haloferax]RDZ45501.1 arylsulfatase [Haloferax sp. Atlit-19N]RDZ61059.1 arylsulfatase [Haloferax sp. Atlit-10N]
MNILLLIMDSVRASNTSLHGHEHRTTPFLESLADEATVYETGISPGSWSLPSHTSIFTGYHVAEHGVTGAKNKLEPGHTIFERLADEEGYSTGIFSENTWVTEMDVGLKETFQTVEGARNIPYVEGLDPSNFVLTEGQGNYAGYLKRCLSHDHPAKSLANGVVTKLAWDYPQYLPDSLKATTPADVYVDLFLDWEETRNDSWAACINLMDGHMPYEPRPEHDNWGGKRLQKLQQDVDDQVWEYLGGHRPWWEKRAMEGLYDGTIRQMDAQIERLVSTLKERGEYEDTLIVVTGDHGEGFGEKSQVKPDVRLAGHGKDVHEAVLHVPLVVKFPGQADSETVSAAASLTEFPRVVDAVLDGEWDCDAFVPDDGAVVASTHGLDEPSQALAEEFCGSVMPYGGVSRTVYETTDEGVVQYQAWEDAASTVRIFDAKTAWKAADTDDGVVSETFGAFDDLGVREESEGIDAAEGATKERLKDLGYL